MAYLFSKVALDLSGSVKSKPVAIRPKKPGLKLWLWKKMVFFIIQFGPLVRERLSLRKKAFPQSVQDIFVDVISNYRNNLTETTVSRSQPGSIELETEALSAQLHFFSTEYWSNIEDADSLAGHVQSYLKER